MVELRSIKPGVAAGGGALSLTGADGAASADPDFDEDTIVNTTCSFAQVVAALNAEDPRAAQQFAIAPAAQAWVGSYLAAPWDQRRQMLLQAQSIPEAQQYVGTAMRVANACNHY
jgi:hemophore-related protein